MIKIDTTGRGFGYSEPLDWTPAFAGETNLMPRLVIPAKAGIQWH